MPLWRDLFCFWPNFFSENSSKIVDGFRYSVMYLKVLIFFSFFLRKKRVIFIPIYHVFLLQNPYLGHKNMFFFFLRLVHPRTMLPTLEIMYCKIKISKPKKRSRNFYKKYQVGGISTPLPNKKNVKGGISPPNPHKGGGYHPLKGVDIPPGGDFPPAHYCSLLSWSLSWSQKSHL